MLVSGWLSFRSDSSWPLVSAKCEYLTSYCVICFSRSKSARLGPPLQVLFRAQTNGGTRTLDKTKGGAFPGQLRSLPISGIIDGDSAQTSSSYPSSVASSLTRMEPHPRPLQHNGRQPELAQSGHADPSPLSICSQGHEPFSVASSSGVERWADSWPLGNQQIWTSPRHRRPRPGLAHGRPGTWQRQLTRGCPEDHAGKNAEGTPQFRQKERRDRSEASATGARARRGGPADVRPHAAPPTPFCGLEPPASSCLSGCAVRLSRTEARGTGSFDSPAPSTVLGSARHVAFSDQCHFTALRVLEQ